jgi:hypothetical protein
MRRLAATLALATSLSGCRSSRALTPLPEEPAELLSVIEMSNPRGFVQLASGFWNLEGNSWRWATKNFKVVLRTPMHAETNGARLQVSLRVPPVIHDRLGSITLDAKINGYSIAPETYSESRNYVYNRPAPVAAFGKKTAVLVEFTTDKSITAPEDTSRELALIILSVGLTTE